MLKKKEIQHSNLVDNKCFSQKSASLAPSPLHPPSKRLKMAKVEGLIRSTSAFSENSTTNGAKNQKLCIRTFSQTSQEHEAIKSQYRTRSKGGVGSVVEELLVGDNNLSCEFDYEYEYTDEDDHNDDYKDNEDDFNSDRSEKYKVCEKSNSACHMSSRDEVLLIPAEDLMPVMKLRVESITDALGIPPEAALAPLRKYKWDKQNIVKSFVDNEEKFTKDCNIYHRIKESREQSDRKLDHSNLKDDDNKQICSICTKDDLTKEEMFAMPCGHEYCKDCWSSYIKTKLEDGQSCIATIICPFEGCTELITEKEVEQITPDYLPIYRTYQLRNFVEGKVTSRWCPGPGCQMVATLPQDSTITKYDYQNTKVTCNECTTVFCFGCGENPHSPLSCRDLASWNEICSNLTQEQISFVKNQNRREPVTKPIFFDGTKICPGCNIRIQKNGGCDHMTCTQCRHEFCWRCGKDWKTHTSCEAYTPVIPSVEVAPFNVYIGDINEGDNFAYFLHRFYDDEERQRILEEEQHQSNISVNEQLIECRKTIKNAYIFRYLHGEYFSSSNRDDNDCMKFHHILERLERFTEELTLLRGNCNEGQLADKTTTVSKTVNALVEHVVDQMYPLIS